MKFEFYHDGLAEVPKLSVDGIVPQSIHFSHWQGNRTPAEVKADTSTEIALRSVGSLNSERLTGGIELITNNHFDTDGVLSVWTMLNGSRALEWRALLIAAAEAGDFSEYSTETGVKISLVIQGSDSPAPDEPSGSPLAMQLAGGEVDDARAYALVLPEIEKVLADVQQYVSLWRAPWERIERALSSFARGESSLQEDDQDAVSLVILAPDIFSTSGFEPTRHAAPFTAISHYANGRFFVVATPVEEGWIYRLDYPYYSWADTVVRPRIERRDLTGTLLKLNEMEGNPQARWATDDSEMTSAAKCFGPDGAVTASRLTPDTVADVLRAEFRGAEAAGT